LFFFCLLSFPFCCPPLFNDASLRVDLHRWPCVFAPMPVAFFFPRIPALLVRVVSAPPRTCAQSLWCPHPELPASWLALPRVFFRCREDFHFFFLVLFTPPLVSPSHGYTVLPTFLSLFFPWGWSFLWVPAGVRIVVVFLLVFLAFFGVFFLVSRFSGSLFLRIFFFFSPPSPLPPATYAEDVFSDWFLGLSSDFPSCFFLCLLRRGRSVGAFVDLFFRPFLLALSPSPDCSLCCIAVFNLFFPSNPPPQRMASDRVVPESMPLYDIGPGRGSLEKRAVVGKSPESLIANKVFSCPLSLLVVAGSFFRVLF